MRIYFLVDENNKDIEEEFSELYSKTLIIL